MSKVDELERPAPLSFETICALVEHINYQIKLLPRLVGSIVAHDQITTTDEVASGYKSEKPYFHGDPIRMVPMLSMRGDLRGPVLVGLPELLAVCGDGIEVVPRWVEGVIQLEARRRY